MAKPQQKLDVSRQAARYIHILEEYSQLTGASFDDVLEDCFDQYIAVTVETHVNALARQAVTA